MADTDFSSFNIYKSIEGRNLGSWNLKVKYDNRRQDARGRRTGDKTREGGRCIQEADRRYQWISTKKKKKSSKKPIFKGQNKLKYFINISAVT